MVEMAGNRTRVQRVQRKASTSLVSLVVSRVRGSNEQNPLPTSRSGGCRLRSRYRCQRDCTLAVVSPVLPRQRETRRTWRQVMPPRQLVVPQ